MGGTLDATGLNGLLGDVKRCDSVVTFDIGIAVDHAEVEHLIDELGDAIAVLYNLMTDGLQLIAADVDIGGGEHLTEAREDIEGRAHLVGYLLDELGLHAG